MSYSKPDRFTVLSHLELGAVLLWGINIDMSRVARPHKVNAKSQIQAVEQESGCQFFSCSLLSYKDNIPFRRW